MSERKTGPKRTKIQRENDYKRIAELYLKGVYQVDIAEELGLAQSQVSTDLKTIRERWREDTSIALDEARARELMKVDQLECTYWEAWENSKQRTVRGKVKKHAFGQSRFLTGVQWCIDQRCKILGIYAEVKSRTRVDVMSVRDMTDDELQEVIDGG